MKIKFNWGTGIVAASIIFMTAAIITGITLMNQKVDLVTDNYYEKELKYQNQIDKLNRTELIKDELSVEYAKGTLVINYKDLTKVNNINGKINFYRPSDSAKDFELPVKLDEQGMQLINTTRVDKGYWKVQINWQINSQDYFFEKSIIIN